MHIGLPPKHKYFNGKMYFRKFTELPSSTGAISRAAELRKLDFRARVMKYKDKAGRVRYAVYARGNSRRLKKERIARAKKAAKKRGTSTRQHASRQRRDAAKRDKQLRSRLRQTA